MNTHQVRIYALALEVWQSSVDADTFMTTPHVLLGGDTPFARSATEDGAKAVESILKNIYWGLPK